jgi:hypothetical protein
MALRLSVHGDRQQKEHIRGRETIGFSPSLSSSLSHSLCSFIGFGGSCNVCNHYPPLFFLALSGLE